MTTKKEEPLTIGKISYAPLILMITIMGAFWLVAFIFIKSHYFADICGPTEAGQFGDAMNLATSFFGSITLAAVFFSINLQRKELHETRLELAQSREEIAKQTANAQLQRFENSFFRIADQLDIKSEGISSTAAGDTVKNEQAFISLMRRYDGEVKGFSESDVDRRREAFTAVINKSYHTMRPYINTMFLLLEMVHNLPESESAQRNYYLKIIGASFSKRRKQFFEAYAKYWSLEEKERKWLNSLLEHALIVD